MAQNLDDYITRSANLANMDIDSIIGKTSQGNSYIPSVQQYYQNKLSQAYLNGTLQKLIDNQKEPVLAGIAKRFQDHITQQNDVSTGNAKTATDTSGTTRQQSDGSGAPSNATGNDGSAQVSTDDLSPKDNIDTSLEKAPVLQNRDRDSSASVQQSSDTGNSHLENSQDGSASLNQVTSQNNTQQTAQNELQANQTTHQVSLGGNTSLGSVNASNQSAAPTVTTTANTSSENTSPSANTSADTSTNQDTNSAEDTQKEKEWNYWFVDDLVEKTDKPTTIAILDGTEKAVQDTEQGQLTKQLVINFIEKDAKDEGTKSSDTEQGDRPSELDAQGKSTRDDSQVQGKGTSDAGSESAKSANGNEGSAQSSDEKGLSHSDTIRYSRKDKINVPKVVIAGNLGSLNNHPDYEMAKKGDASAGLNVAESLVTDKLISDIKGMIGNEKPIVVPVLSVEDGGANTIPSMATALIAEKLGLNSDGNIRQTSFSKRTEKNGLDRIFTPVDFEGHVEKGKKYLIVDDTITQGGTFAGLENHITENGGEVIGSVALSGKQYSGTINLDQKTLQELREKYGDIERRFIDATGYGFEGLTQSEARYILGFKQPERFRARVAIEAGNGLHEVGKGASPNGSSNQQVTKQSDQETNKAPSKEGVSASRGLKSKEGDAKIGKFGKIFTQFYHDAKGAIAALIKEKGGEAIAALHHPEIGDIDLVWGIEGTGASDGMGLSKLLKFHPEIVNNIQNIILGMNVVTNGKNRKILESKDHSATVRLDWDGEAKNWLLTAFKKRGATDTRTDTISTRGKDDTARLTNTSEESISKDKESGKKSEKTKETDKGTALYSRRASDMEFANDILQELAQHDDFFKHDKIESHTISGAVEEALPDARFLGDATREDEKKESGADYRLMFKTAKGNDFYVYTKGKKVWVDISRFENDNSGAGVYNAIAGFAHNAGFEFIGDPAGLSPDATFRRTRAMLSSALRYGTTKHFSAANEQIRGNKEAGIAPLKWGNDDFENIKNLIDSYVQTVENKFPQLRNYNYDFGKQQFVDKAGIPVSRGRFEEGVSKFRGQKNSSGKNTIGSGTIRSYIFLKALLSSEDQSRPNLFRQFSNSALALIRDGGLDKLFSKKSGDIKNSHTANSLTKELTSGKKPFDIAIKRLITELQL